MKRCLLITTSYPTGGPAGGEAAGAFVRDFAVSLGQHVDVTVVAPAAASATASDGNVRVVYFPVPRMPLSLLNPLRPSDWRLIVSALRNGGAAVTHETEILRPDHILALWTLPCGYWARQCAHDLRIPFSTWALGSDIWILGRIPIVRQVLRSTLRAAAHRYADGEQLRTDVERLSGRSCKFLASARLLSCPPRIAPATRPPYKLAFLARWHPNKGPDILIDALERLTAEDWYLIEKVRIAGGGPLANLVEAGVVRLQQAGHPVELHGFMGQQEAAALLAWADWLLIPSRIESIPVIFSDALQAGCAVLSNPVGDLAHLVERLGVGFCAVATDSIAFASVIQRGLRTAPTKFSAAIGAAGGLFNVRESARQFARDTGLAGIEMEVS